MVKLNFTRDMVAIVSAFMSIRAKCMNKEQYLVSDLPTFTPSVYLQQKVTKKFYFSVHNLGYAAANLKKNFNIFGIKW